MSEEEEQRDGGGIVCAHAQGKNPRAEGQLREIRAPRHGREHRERAAARDDSGGSDDRDRPGGDRGELVGAERRVHSSQVRTHPPRQRACHVHALLT